MTSTPQLTGFGGPRISSVDRMHLSAVEILTAAIVHNWDEVHSTTTDADRIEAHQIMRDLAISITRDHRAMFASAIVRGDDPEFFNL